MIMTLEGTSSNKKRRKMEYAEEDCKMLLSKLFQILQQKTNYEQ